MKRVFIMYGAGARTYSAGMEDKLAKLLRSMDLRLVCPPTIPYEQWKSLIKAVDGPPLTDKVIVIGHSMGATACTWIANSVQRPIDLIVAYDPTMWSRQTVPARVKRVIEYHGHTWVNWLGLNLLKSGYKGHFESHSFGSEAHITVDDDMRLHKITAAAIEAL
jgi:pimeloyl-ACP methyl ester carboxylesterase